MAKVNRARPYNCMVAEGNVEGVTPFRKMGHNLDVGATYETIWCRSALFAMPLVFAEKTDIEIRAYSEGGSGKVQATFEGYYL